MAVAKKCDICGKLYEYIACGNKTNGMVTCHINDCQDRYNTRVYDLCPDCINKLNAFIKSKGESIECS